MLCPQLKQNLEVIKTLKSELDLELPKLQELFKELKTNNNPAQLGYMLTPLSVARRDNKKDRIELSNKLKNIKKEIEKNISEIEEKIMSPQEKILKNLLKKLSLESKAYPEGTVEVVLMTIGEKTKAELIKELEARTKLDDNNENKIYISDNAKFMYSSTAFEVLKRPEEITLIRLTVKDLGFTKNATTDQIYQRAAELGLELCPPEVGPYLRLNFTKAFKREQSVGDYLRIAMKQILGFYGSLHVFHVGRDDDGEISFGDDWAKSTDGWNPAIGFVFRLHPAMSHF
jgi:hypothetical protein